MIKNMKSKGHQEITVFSFIYFDLKLQETNF